jgi:hypothetical protein
MQTRLAVRNQIPQAPPSSSSCSTVEVGVYAILFISGLRILYPMSDSPGRLT